MSGIVVIRSGPEGPTGATGPTGPQGPVGPAGPGGMADVADDIARHAGTDIDRVRGFRGVPLVGSDGTTPDPGGVWKYNAQGTPGFKPGKPMLPGWFDVTDYGADPTGVVDCSTIVNNLIVTAGDTPSLSGAVIYFPPGRYKVSSDIKVIRQCTIRGAMGGPRPRSYLVVDPWVRGIVVHAPPTHPETVAGDGDGSVITDLAIYGSLSGLGPYDLPVWQASHTYVLGDKVRGTADGNRRFYREVVEVRSDSKSGTLEPDWGTRIYNDPSENGWDGNVKWQQKVWSGIVCLRRTFVERVFITGFANAGITFYGNGGDGWPTNCSGSRGHKINTSNNGEGILVNGADANVCSFMDCDNEVSGVGLAGTDGHGFDDNSFLGATWVSCQTASSSGYPFRCNPLGFSTLIGCYIEGGGAGPFGAAVIIGGDIANTEEPGSSFTGYDRVSGWRRIQTLDFAHPKVLGLAVDGDRDGRTILKQSVTDGYSQYCWRYEDSVASDPPGWWIFGTEGGFNTRASGYSLRTANEGFGHARTFRGEFRGDATPYYIGYQAIANGDAPMYQYIRSGRNGVPGHLLPGDRFEPPSNGVAAIGQVVTAEGWLAKQTWQTLTAYGTYNGDYLDGTPSDSVHPTTPNGFTYVCCVLGTTGGPEPTWPTTPIGSGGIVPRCWTAAFAIRVGDYFRPSTPNGHYYKCTSVTSPNIRGYGLTGSLEPTWPTGGGSTVVDGAITWTEQGSDVGTYVVDGTVIWQCVGASPTFADYGTPGGGAVGSANELQKTDGAGNFQAATNVRGFSGYVEVGTGTIATVGGIRFPDNTTAIGGYNGSASVAMLAQSGGEVFVGSTPSYGNFASYVRIYGNTGGQLGVGGNAMFSWATSPNNHLESGYPIFGSVGLTSPYGVHGAVSIDISGANHTVSASEYQYAELVFTNTGTFNAFTITFPAPADDARTYWKQLENLTECEQTITTGSGSSYILNPSESAVCRFDSAGVHKIGAPTGGWAVSVPNTSDYELGDDAARAFVIEVETDTHGTEGQNILFNGPVSLTAANGSVPRCTRLFKNINATKSINVANSSLGTGAGVVNIPAGHSKLLVFGVTTAVYALG